ncbi:hypothetical protein LV84_03436 [Algoriphagus ratkowskyi]|uniref:LTXXQ motif family protein n=1 Tax=Algoriphagus ratkowskyi TaxID=57028 RepID=A0A2W7R2F5_9BACT|nr:hypothetical protein [Algoriphagus ratkowskyi]PZX52430.1 hypothetical protein LV84_03436 [Algoriphagus ratkowskyi]TXD76221.1 hypothetical protein ESW18_17480 [Algoriphagus ratkowskyi]
MKKYTLIVLLFFMAAGTTLAQRTDNGYDREKLEAARVAFITTRLDLKPEQAQKFWPIFNVFNDAREKNLKEMSELGRVKDIQLSEVDAKSRLARRFDIERKMIVDEEKFVNELSSVITYNQIILLNGLSREFARHIYQKRDHDKKQ